MRVLQTKRFRSLMLLAAWLQAMTPALTQASQAPGNTGVRRDDGRTGSEALADQREKARQAALAERLQQNRINALNDKANRADAEASTLAEQAGRLFTTKLANPYAGLTKLDELIPPTAKAIAGTVGGVPVLTGGPDTQTTDSGGKIGEVIAAQKVLKDLKHAFDDIGITPELIDRAQSAQRKPGRVPVADDIIAAGKLDLKAKKVQVEALTTAQNPYFSSETAYKYGCELSGPEYADLRGNCIDPNTNVARQGDAQKFGAGTAYLFQSAVYGSPDDAVKPNREVFNAMLPTPTPTPTTAPRRESVPGVTPSKRAQWVPRILEYLFPDAYANGSKCDPKHKEPNARLDCLRQLAGFPSAKAVLHDERVVNTVGNVGAVKGIHTALAFWHMRAAGYAKLDQDTSPPVPRNTTTPVPQIPPASGSFDGSRLRPDNLLREWLGFGTPAWAAEIVPRSINASLLHFEARDFQVDQFIANNPLPTERHFLKEASDTYQAGLKKAAKTVEQLQKSYDESAQQYQNLASRVDALRTQAEKLREQAQQLAQQDPTRGQNENSPGQEEPETAGNENSSPQKGGGEGNPGQRAQLTPPEPAKIPNQTEFPQLQFPQRPEETGIDPRLVELSTRGATNAQLGDLALNPINGNQIFQGIQGTAPVGRNTALNFSPRNLLSRGVPPLQPGDAPGGAIAKGGAGDAAAAGGAGGGGAGPAVGKGGGGDGGGLGGNFENGIGYDPNAGEGARTRQTFSESVSYGAGADGGGSSNGDADAGPPVAAQIVGLAGGGAADTVFLGPNSRRGAKAGDKKVVAVGVLSYVSNLSPILGGRMKKVDFKEALAKASATEPSREPASVTGVTPSLASPGGIGSRVENALRRDGDSTAL